MRESRKSFFLSHSSRDKVIVEQLADGLLDREGLHCWIDIWAIPAASDWHAEILKALASCDAAIIVLGANGWGPFHLAEAKLALQRKAATPEFAVVPVLLDGATRAEMDQLPGFFDRTQHVTFAIGEDDVESESTRRIAAALGYKDPFPFGRAHMSPYAIRRDARRWMPSGPQGTREVSVLYRGDSLVRARALARQFPGQMDAPAFALLDASEAAERARMRTRIVMTTLLAILLAALAGVAWFLKGEADRSAQEAADSASAAAASAEKAVVSARDARAGELANLAKVVRDQDPSLALRIAEVAYSLNPSLPAVQQALLEIYYNDRWGRRLEAAHQLRGLAVAADGRVAVGGYGPIVSIRDANDAAVATIDVGSRHVTSVAFSPDGQQLLIGSYDKGARLYTAAGAFVRALGADSAVVFAVAFAADGASAFVGGLSGGLFRHMLTGDGVQHYPESEGNIQAIAVSLDGARVGVGFHGGEARIWPVDNSKSPVTCVVGSRGWDAVRAVGFIEGGRLVTGHDDGSLAVWGGDGTLLHRVQAHAGTVWGLAVGPVTHAGSTIATFGFDRRASVWDLPGSVSDLQKVRQPRVVLRGHQNWVTAGAFAPTGDIYTASTGSSLRRWFMSEGRDTPIGGPDDYFTFAAFHPSQPTLLMNKRQGSVLVGLDGTPVRELAPPSPDQPQIPSPDGRGYVSMLGPTSQGVFSGDGATVATAHYDRRVHLWDLSRSGPAPVRSLSGFADVVTALCLRRAPPVVIAGDRSGLVLAWDSEQGAPRQFAKLASEIVGIACSPDDLEIAVTAGSYFPRQDDGGQIVRVFSAQGAVLREWKGAQDQVGRPAYRPGGGLVLPANGFDIERRGLPELAAEKQVYVFESDGTVRRKLGGHPERVSAVAVSRDDRYVLTAGGFANSQTARGDAARLWDIQGNLLLELPAGAPVIGVTFSGDGVYFATVEDHAVRLWRTPKGIIEWLIRSRLDALTPAERRSLVETGTMP